MARTIEEIKQQMTDAFMADSSVQDKYGFAAGEQFYNHFSKVSIESLLFYIVAVAVWTLEKIFDTHKADVDAALEARQPCTARWYRDQILALRDTNDQPVCTACAIDSNGDVMLVKVQSGPVGSRTSLNSTQEGIVNAFLGTYGLPGVQSKVRTTEPDVLAGTVTYWYDPRELDPDDGAVSDAIASLVANLPYDGILAASDIQDTVLAVPGVRRVRMQDMLTKRAGGVYAPLGVQRNTYSGSWTLDPSEFIVNAIPYTTADIA